MENPSGSIFNYHESCDELRRKLLDTTRELNTMKNVKRELLNLLKMAYLERDEARQELQKLVTKLTPPTLFEVPASMMINPAPTKANSSITESNSTSHVSSPVDSLLEAVSPPEFSNMNNIVESYHNLGYIKQQPLVQNNMSVSQKPRTCDVGDQVIEYLAKGKALPQKGNFLKAVMDAGPLLQTLLVAGPLPTWRNPPPLQNIKIPPLNVQDFASNNLNTLNSLQKPPMLASSHSSQPTMLNVAAVNNSFQMTPNATCKNLAPSRIPQSHQCLLRN